jgi:acyl-coenzyme A thioesterase PaaI-like protein
MAVHPFEHTWHCFVCSDDEGGRIQNQFQWDDERLEVRSTAHLGPKAQGAHGLVHGGGLFSLVDEAMGLVCWAQGHKVLAAHVEIDYRNAVPIDSQIDVSARIERIDGRKLHAIGEIRHNGRVAATAKGLYVRIRDDLLKG